MTPIKQQGRKVGTIEKVPIVIKAHRDGFLRTAELLHILMAMKTREGRAIPKETLLFEQWPHYQRSKRVTQGWLMHWYHQRAEEARIPHHRLIKPHSFRIGGATAIMAAGHSQQTIKNMGRWV